MTPSTVDRRSRRLQNIVVKPLAAVHTAVRRSRQTQPWPLHLAPHINAPVADLPVRRAVAAHHFPADLPLPYGRILYDYNKED